MDDFSSRRREPNHSSSKEAQDHNSTKRCSSWEDLCVHEVESDSSPETLFSTEQRDVEQKLWFSFQSTASAIAQLYKDRVQENEEMWAAFQNAAEIATNLYRESVDGTRSVSELAIQCGYHRRNKELLSWAKKRKRHLRREDLIGYLCGRSPPRRVSRSPSLTRGSDSPDHRRPGFHDGATMSDFHPDLPNLLSDEMMRRGDPAPSSSRKRSTSSHNHNPSSPKRRR